MNYTSPIGLQIVATGLERNATYDVTTTNACSAVNSSFKVDDYPSFVPSNPITQPCIGEPYEVCFPVMQGTTPQWTHNGNPMFKMGSCLPISSYETVFDGVYHVGINYASGCVVRSYDLTLTGKNCALPVKLVAFDVNNLEGTNKLNWSTSEESNANKFELQRSEDAKTWVKIAAIEAAGSSNQRIDYNFTDTSYLQGINYYRLKMVDLDETFAYSTIKSVTNAELDLVVMPNPAVDRIQIKSGLILKEAVVTDLNGKIVFKAQSKSLLDKLEIGRLPQGLYVLKVTTDKNQTFTKKLFINR